MSTAHDEQAVVVGSGPNGLVAAAVLAAAGRSVDVFEAADEPGGGTRSAELTVPGLVHDVCSAVHPLGAVSPCFAALDLGAHGLEWRWPEVDLAHPFDDGTAASIRGSVDTTAAGLGVAGARWRRVFGPPADRFEAVAPDVLGPLLRVPRHPVGVASLGLRAAPPATVVARALGDDRAAALFLGCAAHQMTRLDRPLSAAAGTALVAAGHAAGGWPVASGGSAAIASALVTEVERRGGRIHTGHVVRSLADVPPAGITMLDVSPRSALALLGDRLPARVERAWARWRHGPAAFKVDLAVDGGVPWLAHEARRAGTVHVAGDAAEVVVAEREVVAGRMPERPFVLVAQQSVADPGRARDGIHPVWAYAHVPHGYDRDVTGAIVAAIERFAPGLRDRIVASVSTAPGALERYDANDVGGDIAGGANDARQLVFRPRVTAHPYDTGVDGVYLCSASTPPGAGVHGMCGWWAADRALAVAGGPRPRLAG